MLDGGNELKSGTRERQSIDDHRIRKRQGRGLVTYIAKIVVSAAPYQTVFSACHVVVCPGGAEA
jgi:hypothetical protein